MPENEDLRGLGSDHPRKKSIFKTPEFNLQNLLISLLIIALVVVGLYAFKPELFKGLGKTQKAAKQEEKEEVKSSGYSAVFLANNQVYFGKLEDESSQYPKLKDVYYLRVERQLQPPPATESAQPELSLVKLGNELHGPIDEIRFNREQILFIEDLKDDGRVVKAINEHKNRK